MIFGSWLFHCACILIEIVFIYSRVNVNHFWGYSVLAGLPKAVSLKPALFNKDSSKCYRGFKTPPKTDLLLDRSRKIEVKLNGGSSSVYTLIVGNPVVCHLLSPAVRQRCPAYSWRALPSPVRSAWGAWRLGWKEEAKLKGCVCSPGEGGWPPSGQCWRQRRYTDKPLPW